MDSCGLNARGEFPRTEIGRTESCGWRANGEVCGAQPVQSDIKAQPVSTGANHARDVLGIGTEVSLFLGGHGKSDLGSRATIVAGLLGDPNGCLYRGCSPVRHSLKLDLHGLPHLRLIVNGYKPSRINVSPVGVVVHADVVTGDMAL